MRVITILNFINCRDSKMVQEYNFTDLGIIEGNW